MTNEVTETRATDHVSDNVPAKRKQGGTPGNRGGQIGRSGPPGNRNAWKHGGYARLTLSNMPKGLQGVQRVVNELRGGLELACKEAHGTITPLQAATINTAVWNERLLRLWAKRLADNYTRLDDNNVAMATDRIAKHTAARDAAIRVLDLDRNSDSPWHDIYRPPAIDVEPAHNGDKHARLPCPDDSAPPDTQQPAPAENAATHALGALNATPPPGSFGNPATKGNDRLGADPSSAPADSKVSDDSAAGGFTQGDGKATAPTMGSTGFMGGAAPDKLSLAGMASSAGGPLPEPAPEPGTWAIPRLAADDRDPSE